MQSKSNSTLNNGRPGTSVETEESDSAGQTDTVQAVQTGDLGLDQVFEILKNQRRRYVLEYLRDRSEPVSLSDLSEQIAAWENDKEVRKITSSERKRVYVGLYQCHLPKMDGMGVVSFNKPRAIIEPGENIDIFYSYLDAPNQQEERVWSKYYLGLSVASLLALLGGALVELAMSVPATYAVAGVSLVAFATTAFLHRANGHEDEGEDESSSVPFGLSDS